MKGKVEIKCGKIDVLGITELKWSIMDHFQSDTA